MLCNLCYSNRISVAVCVESYTGDRVPTSFTIDESRWSNSFHALTTRPRSLSACLCHSASIDQRSLLLYDALDFIGNRI